MRDGVGLDRGRHLEAHLVDGAQEARVEVEGRKRHAGGSFRGHGWAHFSLPQIGQCTPLDAEDAAGKRGLGRTGSLVNRRSGQTPEVYRTRTPFATISGAASIRVAILRCSVARDAQRTGSTPRIPGSTGTSSGSRLATAPDGRTTTVR